MSQSTGDAKLEQWRTFFKHHDKDGSGEIQAFEFKGIHEALVKNNIPVPSDVLECFYAIDKNRSGTISFDEFCIYLTKLRGK